MTKKERSYGIIPLRKAAIGWEVLLVKHHAGHWAFPKGHPEKGEEPYETAIRELHEETGLSVLRFLPGGPLQEHYFFTFEGQRIDKTVEYFPAEVKGEARPQEEEIEELRWIALQDAEALITFPEGKRVCQLFFSTLIEKKKSL